LGLDFIDIRPQLLKILYRGHVGCAVGSFRNQLIDCIKHTTKLSAITIFSDNLPFCFR